ncbi:major facilitator superfamily transporter [Colletotrichum kahawae]|uniref:Major facilitator superfamily transporter n=1 Tax=Colletotrichum kahawae TaxID=34407 RepID=A0AAD9YQS9_COLKA|nr:major facilitator superfamily transporter [Colletotrichum kahawae]
MQSLLQYRRAGVAAQAQIDRDMGAAASSSQLASHQRSETGQVFDEEKAHPAHPEERPGQVLEPSGDSSAESSNAEDIERVGTTRTQYSEGTALGRVLTGIHVRDRTAHEGHGGRIFVVGWAGPDDPLDPHNWSLARRIGVTLQISVIALFVGAASGIDATVLPQAAKDLGVSEVAESMATGLYLVGMGVGSLIAGPFSETFGRNAVYIVSMGVFMLWIMASGLAPNFGAQIVFRFLAGCSASTPLTWSFPLYAITCFGGPMIGAVMGAYIGPSPLVSWRWTEWTMMICSGLVLVLVGLCMPETYGPLLLQWKAAHYRRITGDDRFRSEHEIVDATLFTRLKTSMTRPFLMLTEPIIIAMTLYITDVYIVLFTFLVGWPDIFEKTYGLDQGLANIIFIAMFVGTQINFAFVPLVCRMTVSRMKQTADGSFEPGIRLWYAMFGAAISVPVSLFWLGWTNFASISIWSAIFAVVVFGYGVTGIFIYIVAGGMTIVGIPFYDKMGTHYTLTILGCIAALLAPIPYVLYYYGPWIRSKSKYAVSMKTQ